MQRSQFLAEAINTPNNKVAGDFFLIITFSGSTLGEGTKTTRSNSAGGGGGGGRSTSTRSSASSCRIGADSRACGTTTG
ncbi:hypothetical protein G6F56_014440 [Rhizopus delemar]|nr:hypothetical protein G6F56_014440 [Rhizopus delemar]